MKIAKLFQTGLSQAVRLPKIQNTTVLIPINNPWKPLFRSLNKFSDDFMATRDQLEHQKRDET